MSFQVTARKWRPQVFAEIVGQAHVTSTLRNALATHRVAHAYLFSGPRGSGKTTTARILAKALNCLSPKDTDPDNTCDICLEITEGRSLDVIEIDGASNRGVEEIRNLREAVRYTPTRSKFKIYIIDEVHMLTKEAFNALLKTLEEPPSHVIFVFATTEVHKVPATILSRCQRFDFRRISIDEISGRLRVIAAAEGVEIENDALIVIARKGDGSLRDAQSIFDQVRSFCGNIIKTGDVLATLNVVDEEIYFRVSALVQAGNQRDAIQLVDEIVRGGHDLREFVLGLAEHFRNLLISKTTGSTHLIETSEHFREKYEVAAKEFDEPDLLRLIKLTNDLDQAIRWAAQPRFRLEAGLVQMTNMEKSVKISDLLRRLEEVKKKLEGSAETSHPTGSLTETYPRKTDRSPSDVKIVGTVSAGRLSSPLTIPVGPGSLQVPGATPRVVLQRPPAYGLQSSASAPVVLEASSHPQAGSQSISAREAYARWQEWIGEVTREKISIGSVLRETKLLDLNEGALRIGCPDDYHLSSLKRNREFLGESFRKLTGRSVRIEPVLENISLGLAPAAGFESRLGLSSKGPADPDVHNGNRKEHPVIAALHRELGAEPVG